MMVTLLVVDGICKLADSLGKKEISTLGEQCRKYLVIAFILAVVGKFFVAINPGNPNYMSASMITAYLLEIVVYVLYLRILGKVRMMQRSRDKWRRERIWSISWKHRI